MSGTGGAADANGWGVYAGDGGAEHQGAIIPWMSGPATAPSLFMLLLVYSFYDVFARRPGVWNARVHGKARAER